MDCLSVSGAFVSVNVLLSIGIGSSQCAAGLQAATAGNDRWSRTGVYVPTNVKPVISVGVERLEIKAMLALVIVTNRCPKDYALCVRMVTFVDQEQVPAGTTTVSPDDAKLMAACTAEAAHELASTVLACTATHRNTPQV